MFIKLTEISGKPIYVAISAIAYFYPCDGDPGEGNTFIKLKSDEHTLVTECAEDIYEYIDAEGGSA